jgi:hypothetical protein
MKGFIMRFIKQQGDDKGMGQCTIWKFNSHGNRDIRTQFNMKILKENAIGNPRHG